MSDDFAEATPVSAYGQQRREAWLAGLRANSDLMSAASMEAHRAEHDVITAGQNGLYGALSPQEKAAAVAARAATVGSAWGHGRPLERQGGLYNHNFGPAPARVDLRNADRQGQEPGMSPLLAHMRGQQ